MKRTYWILSTTALACASVHASADQTAADRPLQENAPRQLRAPRAAPALPLALPAQPAAVAGGVSVTLSGVALTGNTALSEQELLDALGDVKGKSYDFSGLSALAARISSYYQGKGYPFARAYLAQQDLQDGQLRIHVLEGRYGQVRAHGDPAFTDSAQAFLSSLQPGALIESLALERATLILDDLPGAKTTPLIRPGQEVGTGDLLVEVQRKRRYAGEAGIDNYGSRHTGRNRARVSLDLDSPFMLGDQIALQGLYTDKQMWFGALGYARPLGASGLRARLGYAHSYYALAGSFASLGATGTADVGSATLSYPLIRSQQRNVTLSAGIEHKRLNDRQGAVGSSDKSSDTVPLTANFDMRDTLLHGGITYGALSLTSGRLHLDSQLEPADQASARTAGGFHKLNLDLARIQSLSDNTDLYGRISTQWANKNLDSSQKFGLGGQNGVRAYPSGEGYGDTGMLAQLELRYAFGSCVPYLFYDSGRVTVNRNTWEAGENGRRIGGGGTGVRYLNGSVKAELVLAWRTQGGAPRSDSRDSKPTVWASLDYRF